MKITGIEIGEYRQFKNIKFDFTYPSDHAKAGQPLDKVCFIGQSGTGKTTLLNVLWEFFMLTNVAYQFIKKRNPIYSDSKFYDAFYHYISIFIEDKSTRSFYTGDILKEADNPRTVQISNAMNWLRETEFLQHYDDLEKTCLYIKDSVAREADAFLFDQKDQPQTFSDFIKTDIQIENEKTTREERVNEANFKKAVALGDTQSLSTWQYLLREINAYDEATVQEITKIVQSTPQNKITEELQKWIAADPRIELAEKCLNPILDKFYLEVNIGAKGNVPIALQTKQGVKIDSSYLSTGTRQILATSIPLYKFDTKDTVILFDEPERSLFPDVQRELIDHYTSLAPGAQFFFATHSPIIASAFEPCERFILYFDENGEVDFRNGVAPEGDDPNDILHQDFDLAELMLQKGLEEHERYRQLAMQIRAESNEARKNELIAERVELGNRYNF